MASRVGSTFPPLYISTLHCYDYIYEVYLLSGWAEDVNINLEKKIHVMWKFEIGSLLYSKNQLNHFFGGLELP